MQLSSNSRLNTANGPFVTCYKNAILKINKPTGTRRKMEVTILNDVYSLFVLVDFSLSSLACLYHMAGQLQRAHCPITMFAGSLSCSEAFSPGTLVSPHLLRFLHFLKTQYLT